MIDDAMAPLYLIAVVTAWLVVANIQ